MRVGGSGPGDRGRRTAAVLVGASMVAGAAACSGGEKTDDRYAVKLAVSPAGGGSALRPDSPIAVQARSGTIEDVTVSTDGTEVEGDLNGDRTRWRSRWTLEPGEKYTVDATGLGKDGRTRTVRSSFTTAKVKKNDVKFEAPFNKETVGVGMPIIMQFDRTVKDKAAVERALVVRSDKTVEGAWHWFGGKEVVFRPKKYWPAKTKVSLQAHLSGVRTGGNVYVGKNYTRDFKVGDSHVSTASENSHKMVVRVNGKKVRTIPLSMGKGGVRKYTTTNGVHLAMSKEDPTIMTSSWEGCGPGCPGYYSLTVYKSVRISDSGEYVHSAPWSVGSQGRANVSHGCINISPSNAAWFFRHTRRGDPVVVTGSNRELEPENGWGYWQLSWKKWVKGSALERSVKTVPHEDAATLSAPRGDRAAPRPGEQRGEGD